MKAKRRSDGLVRGVSTAGDENYDGNRLPLVLTMGDPAGIGPEITAKAWATLHDAEPGRAFYVIGDAGLFESIPEFASVPVVRLSDPEPDASGAFIAQVRAAFRAGLPVLHRPLPAPVVPGTAAAGNAPAVISSIETAVGHVARGLGAAVVTNPIAKHVLYEAGFSHPGHTEFLGQLAGRYWSGEPRCDPVMMLVAPGLRVVPVTVHIALGDVSDALTEAGIVTTCQTVIAALKADFGISAPRLAVTGLNPHAGEGGALGSEDASVIAPAIAALRERGHDVTGPHPADAIFHSGARAGYDAAVAMYHDQALIPIKTLAFDDAVNVTLGLAFVRTSPDHGTAFEIAGQGVARPDSLIAAIRLAGALARNRMTAAARSGDGAAV